MAQAELFDIDSPCISVCEMDDKGYCKGCLRNRTERQLWHAMTDEQKRQVLRLLFIRQKKRSRSVSFSQYTEESTKDNAKDSNASLQPNLFNNLL